MNPLISSRRRLLAQAGVGIGVGAALTLPRSSAAQTPNVPPFYLTEPRPLPNFTFTNQAGHPRSLSSFHGKFILLNIWATWCIPCRKEMPTLDRLQATLGDKQFEIVPVSIDSGGLKAVQKFYTGIHIQHLGIFLDPSGSAMQILNLEGLPTSFLINPAGQQIGRETGGTVWDTPSVIRFFKHQFLTGA